MKLLNKILTSVCLAFISVTVSAGTGEGRISNYIVAYNGMFFFQTESIPDKIGCNTQNAFAVSTIGANASAGKAIMATVIAADAQGKAVRVIGKGNCDTWGDRETVDYILIYRSPS